VATLQVRGGLTSAAFCMAAWPDFCGCFCCTLAGLAESSVRQASRTDKGEKRNLFQRQTFSLRMYCIAEKHVEAILLQLIFE
jgi:hypothetical protein